MQSLHTYIGRIAGFAFILSSSGKSVSKFTATRKFLRMGRVDLFDDDEGVGIVDWGVAC